MNLLHQIAIVIHVVTAILGLGLTTANAIAISYARQNQNAAATMKPLVLRYFSLISGALGLMLLSGLALDGASQGAWDKTLFFRIGFLMIFVLGALAGISGGRLRKVSDADAPALLAKLGAFAWTMCGLVAFVAMLMVLKPG